MDGMALQTSNGEVAGRTPYRDRQGARRLLPRTATAQFSRVATSILVIIEIASPDARPVDRELRLRGTSPRWRESLSAAASATHVHI